MPCSQLVNLTDELTTTCEEQRKAQATCPDHEATVALWHANLESLGFAYRLLGDLSREQVNR